MYTPDELKRILHVLNVFAFHQYEGNTFSKFLSIKYHCDAGEGDFISRCIVVIYTDKINIKYNAPATVSNDSVVSTECELSIPVDADKLINELQTLLKNLYTTTAYQPTELPHGYAANTLAEVVAKTIARDIPSTQRLSV